MRILVGHNFYQQSGGEDAVARLEVDLLRAQGHEVCFVEVFNRDFNDLSIQSKIRNVLSWKWSQASYDLIRQHCLEFRPDVAHFHNTFFMMTPSVYAACKSVGVPVVQTLHNFRLLCSNALFYRNGHVCEECLKSSLSCGIKYGCYRSSRVLTWAVVRMLKEHWQRKTWSTKVDAFIALTEFARYKFEQGGLPKEKIWVKPNSVAIDPGLRLESADYFVFAGRLSEEKGIRVLLEACRVIPQIKLVIMGDGPMKSFVQEYIEKYELNNVDLKGFLGKEEYLKVLKKAIAVVVPSVCYENFPMAIVEAFACGVSVIASKHGAMQELVQESNTGLLFLPGNYKDLSEKMKDLMNSPQKAIAMGIEARRVFQERFSSQHNYQKLISIYEYARKNAAA